MTRTSVRCARAGLWPARLSRPASLLVTTAGLTVGLVLALAACAAPAREPDRATLAGNRSTPPAPSAVLSPSEPQIGPEPTAGPTPVGGLPWDDSVSRTCAGTLGPVYTEVAQTADEIGTTSFWVAGDRWASCDVLRDSAAEPAVVKSHDGAGSGFDARSLLVSSTVVPGQGGGSGGVRFTAGGPLPWPVQEISYRFPDGHVEQARFVRSVDGGEVWWAVAYTATEGALVDPGTRSADLDPVTVSILGAAAEAFRLPWEDVQRSE